MHIGLLLFGITCVWRWQSKSLTWDLQPLSCNIYIYIRYMSLLKDLRNRCFDLVNAHRAATVWNNVRLKLTLQVANLKPTAFILWYIYICLMFCWRSEKQELGTLSNRFTSKPCMLRNLHVWKQSIQRRRWGRQPHGYSLAIRKYRGKCIFVKVSKIGFLKKAFKRASKKGLRSVDPFWKPFCSQT